MHAFVFIRCLLHICIILRYFYYGLSYDFDEGWLQDLHEVTSSKLLLSYTKLGYTFVDLLAIVKPKLQLGFTKYPL